MRRHSDRAFSLLEVIIYCAILMGLMAGLYLLLIAGLRYFRTGELHQRVLQEAAVAMRKMSKEVANTGPDYIDNSALPGAFIFRSADNVSGSGNAGNWTYNGPTLQWQKWVCYYRHTATNTLYRTELPSSWNVTQPPAGSPGFAAMSDPAIPLPPPLDPRRSILGRGITRIQFGVLVDRVTINVTAEDETGSRVGQVTNVTLRNQVRMENQVQP